MRSLLINVEVPVLDAEMRLYRACAGSADGVAIDSFRSHYELKRPHRSPENRSTAIHMALSMFEEPEPCWNLLERTHGRIGDDVAELRLTPGRGICVARRAGPLHPNDVFFVTQDDDGQMVGEAVYGLSLVFA